MGKKVEVTSSGENIDTMSVIKELFDKLNDAVEEKIGKRPFFVKGSRIGFEDGGQDSEIAPKLLNMFSNYDMMEAMSWGEPNSMNYMVCDTMRYGLRTHNLYNKDGIMVGSNGPTLFFTSF